MAEQAEQQAESNEVPEGTGPTGYRESADHIPDPTAMTGTLETSGTGGGHNERITGTTRIFGDVEAVIGKVEAIVAEHLHDVVDEVRGVLKREEANAVATNLPQQTVEHGGVPEHGGNIVLPGDDTGAATDANRSANVAGDAGGVDAGTTRVADGGQGSYSQQTIAGASNPQEQNSKAVAGEERREGDGAGETPQTGTPAKTTAKTTAKAPAKKTAAKKTDADK